MWADGRPRGWCRRCLYFDFADGRQEYSDSDRLEWERTRRQLAEREVVRLQTKLEWFRSGHTWNIYHDQMEERHRALWRQAGVPDSIQDWLRLGYTEERTFYHDDTPLKAPALTIPYFEPEWKAATMQYRLLRSDISDRYRFQAGLPAPLYLTDPDVRPKGPCILGEGAKKGIVGFMHLGERLKGGAVVASPSKNPRSDSLTILDQCDPIYLCLDPDAEMEQLKRIALILGPERVRVVTLPVKLDDAFVLYGGRGEDIWPFFQIARPALSL